MYGPGTTWSRQAVGAVRATGNWGHLTAKNPFASTNGSDCSEWRWQGPGPQALRMAESGSVVSVWKYMNSPQPRGVPSFRAPSGYATATLAPSKGRLMRCTVDGLTPNRSAMTRMPGRPGVARASRIRFSSARRRRLRSPSSCFWRLWIEEGAVAPCNSNAWKLSLTLTSRPRGTPAICRGRAHRAGR